MWRLLCLFFLPALLFASFEEYIHFNAEGPNEVGYLYIGDHEKQINSSTLLYVKNALEHYQESKPIFIILKLDTPGGQVFAAQKISDLLKDMDTQYDIPIVTVIDNWAISAGAMLAYSSRFITATKDASMGAAAPVTGTGEGTSEKVNSAIRTDFASRASFFDRNPLIAEAMVDADVILVWRDGQVVQLQDDDEIKASDQVITKEGKLLTLNSKQLIEYGVADLRLLPEKLVPITDAEKEAGSWPASKELLFTTPFFKKIPNATIDVFQMDWKTKFFSFLASPIVSSILVLGLMLGAYIEISTPGFGFAGILAVVCLFFILLSSFSLQAANWFEVIILLVGVVLILVEIFVTPGFGFIGVVGILLALGGLFALLLPGFREVTFDFDTNTFNAAGSYILERLVWLCGTFVVGVIAIALLAKFVLPKVALFSPLVLRREQEGYVAGLKPEELPDIGAKGVVVAPLRTAGKVEIGGEVFDAVSSGSFLEVGQKIRVIGVEGSKMIVEEEK